MVSPDTVVATALGGVAYGLVLTLLGVGITLVYGLGELLNLAIGMFAVMTVLLTATFRSWGVGLPVAAVSALVLIGAFGYGIDRTLLSLVYREEGEKRVRVGIFTTVGLSVFLSGVLVNYFRSRYALRTGFGTTRLDAAVVSVDTLFVITVAGIVLIALFTFLRHTYLGRSARTVFQDERGAVLVGIDPRRIRRLMFVLSTVIAGIAGLLLAVSSPVSVSSGLELTTFGLIVSIVGGVRSVPGTVAAGVFLGVLIQFANFVIGSYLATIVLYITVIVALVVRPEVTRH